MQDQSRLALDLPLPEERIFRYAAMDDVISHLVADPTVAFTHAELAAATDHDESTIYRAVALLAELGVVTVGDERPSLVTIHDDHLTTDDALLQIPQPAFRAPVRAYCEELRERLAAHDRIDELVGVVLFGSVARGTADRVSDVDLLVVVEGSKAHARREVTAVASDLAERRFDGDRYEFEVLVETVESARRRAASLRPIFEEGIVLHRSSELQAVRRFVYESEPAAGDAN